RANAYEGAARLKRQHVAFAGDGRQRLRLQKKTRLCRVITRKIDGLAYFLDTVFQSFSGLTRHQCDEFAAMLDQQLGVTLDDLGSRRCADLLPGCLCVASFACAGFDYGNRCRVPAADALPGGGVDDLHCVAAGSAIAEFVFLGRVPSDGRKKFAACLCAVPVDARRIESLWLPDVEWHGQWRGGAGFRKKGFGSTRLERMWFG